MSFQATTWALHQVTGSASAKAVLLALANYAGERGECRPSLERLAADTEQSARTVMRRMQELARKKFIFRAERKWRDAGRYGTGQTIVLFNETSIAYAAYLGFDIDGAAGIEDEACDELEISEAESAEANENEPFETSDHVPDCHLAKLDVNRARQVTDCHPVNPNLPDQVTTDAQVPRLSPGPGDTGVTQNNQFKKDSTPLNPPTKKTEADLTEWPEFEKLWPWPPGAPHEPSRRMFHKLCAAERSLAIRYAADHLAFRRQQGRHIGDARRYLADKAWEAFTKRSSAKSTGGIWVRKGTPAWEAWEAHYRLLGKLGPLGLFSSYSSLEKCEGRREATLFPPRTDQSTHPNARAGPSADEMENIEF